MGRAGNSRKSENSGQRINSEKSENLGKRINSGKPVKSLGEAELEIMQVIWAAKESVTSNYIWKELQGKRSWQLSTLMTSLSRLGDKGFVDCNRETGTNLYAAVISENDYKTRESRNFLEKLYNNSVQSLITTLYSNKVIKSADVEELKRFLEQLEREEESE